MRKLLLNYFCWPIICFGLLNSCDKNISTVDKELRDVVIISKNSVRLSDSGFVEIVNISSNMEKLEVSTDKEWLQFKYENNALSIFADVNESFESRSGYIIIKGNNVRDSIRVVQAEKNEISEFVFENIEFVKVEGGSFFMGAQNEDPNGINYGVSSYGRSDYAENQTPVHKVNVSTFFISKYLITRDQWNNIMDYDPTYDHGPDSGDYPADGIDFSMANEFCEELTKKVDNGIVFRLPTEAEWEYAASGGQKTHGYIYSGSNDPDEVGIFIPDASLRDENTSVKVGSFAPNELGIYDMSGNLYEWTSDYFGPYSNEELTDPTGPESGDERSIRGASWWHFYTTIYYRGHPKEDYTGKANGRKGGLMGIRLVYKED